MRQPTLEELSLIAARVFGLPIEIHQQILRGTNEREAVMLWRRCLPDLTRHWKQVARGAHPDAGGNHEKFVELKAAWDVVQSEYFAVGLWRAAHLRARPAAPIRPRNPTTTTVHVMGWTFTQDTTSSTTSTGGSATFYTGGDPWFIRRM